MPAPVNASASSVAESTSLYFVTVVSQLNSGPIGPNCRTRREHDVGLLVAG